MFRTYDIRGVVGRSLTPEIVRDIGRALGSLGRERKAPVFAVCRDGRVSGPELVAALTQGLNAAGADVVGPENLGWNAHKFRNSKRCWGSQPRRPGNGAARNPAWPPVRGNSSTTHGAAFRAARSRSRSGRNGSLRALSTSVGTRMCSRYGPHAAAPQ